MIPHASAGVLLFGNMGAAKSSLGNTIIGKQNKFREGDSAASVTSVIQVESVDKPAGGKLHVLDVPGLGNPDVEKFEYAKQFIAELSQAMQGRELKTVILVKKASDFRVDA